MMMARGVLWVWTGQPCLSLSRAPALMMMGIEHKYPRRTQRSTETLVGRFDNVGRDPP